MEERQERAFGLTVCELVRCHVWILKLFHAHGKIGLFQPFPLKHREVKIKPFSTMKLAIIKMANSSMGSSFLLLRKQGQKWTLIMLCSSTDTGTAGNSKPQSPRVSPGKSNAPVSTPLPWDEVVQCRYSYKYSEQRGFVHTAQCNINSLKLLEMRLCWSDGRLLLPGR